MIEMKQSIERTLSRSKGFTLLELLIAVAITGVLATATLSFFSGMHNQSVTQRNVAEMQDLSRATLMEIKKTLRMGGFKLTGHPPYEIFGTTLGVYMSRSQPVDTIWYFLEEYNESEYAALTDLPEGRRLWRLKKQTNSGLPDIFSDFIVNVRYTVIDSVNVEITVTTQTPMKDMGWRADNGYRTYVSQERVRIRNIG
jgi:prepilin-type N-terminal cleavage/methylation domain-containing protein